MEKNAKKVIRIPTSDRLKERLAVFERRLGGWRVTLEDLRGAKPGLVWGVGSESAVVHGLECLRRQSSFLEKSEELLANSPLWCWSELGQELEKLAVFARDLLTDEETLLGLLASALSPVALRSQLDLAKDLKSEVNRGYLELGKKLDRRAWLLCPWTLGLGEEGELRH